MTFNLDSGLESTRDKVGLELKTIKFWLLGRETAWPKSEIVSTQVAPMPDVTNRKLREVKKKFLAFSSNVTMIRC